MDGNRLAIIDLPEPGLPTKRMLCPPAQATSTARLTFSWPLTSRKSGRGRVVGSGIPRGETLVNFVYVSGRAPVLCAERKIGGDRSGTGDVFASVILADAVNGVDFAESVRRASAFTASAVRRSVELGLPEKDGLAIEEVIGELVK